jgi:hypothetical protein
MHRIRWGGIGCGSGRFVASEWEAWLDAAAESLLGFVQQESAFVGLGPVVSVDYGHGVIEIEVGGSWFGEELAAAMIEAGVD